MKCISTLFVFAGLIIPVFGEANLAILDKDDVILFQGDSITDAGRDRIVNNSKNSLGDGYVSMIAAQIGEKIPGRKLTFINRGIGGNRVTDLAARWQADTLDLKPNFLSILIGINDTLSTFGGQESVETYEQVYDKLIANTLAALPKVNILLGEPFLLPVGDDRTWYDLKMVELRKRQGIVARLAAKYHLALVQYQRAFDDGCKKAPPEHWSEDGVHPTTAGHELMAQEWLKTVNDFWPQRVKPAR